MEHDNDTTEPGRADRPRGPFNFAAFLIAFLFVWLVFDNFALGLVFGLLFSGGSEVAQRAAADKSD